MAPSAKAKTPATASKTKRPVTLKHLAAVLAEEHQLTKKAGEALLGDRWLDHEASQEGRTNPYCGPRHPAGQEAGGAYGAQSCSRRSNPDQGKQKGRFPGGQGFEDGALRPYRTLCVVNESWRGGGSSLSQSVEGYPAWREFIAVWKRATAIYRGVEAQFQGAAYHAKHNMAPPALSGRVRKDTVNVCSGDQKWRAVR